MNVIRYRVASLRDRLLTPERPVRYLLIAWACAFFPAVLLSALVTSVTPDATQPDFPFGSGFVFLLVVIMAPVSETLLMGSVLLLLRRAVPDHWAAMLSSAGWGVAHSMQAPAWGLVIWWPFLIFSATFLVWRQRGVATAFAMASALHAAHNLLPGLGLLLAD